MFDKRFTSNACLFGIAMLLGVSPALATDQNNVTASYVGAIASGTAYFQLNVGLADANCVYGALYIDLSTTGGRAAYATLLTAKSMSPAKPINVTYFRNGSNQCYVSILTMVP